MASVYDPDTSLNTLMEASVAGSGYRVGVPGARNVETCCARLHSAFMLYAALMF